MKINTGIIAAGALASLVACTSADAGLVWLNELHYDNTGTDAGEFVEIVIAPGGPSIANITVTLYNGATGQTYAPILLGTAATAGAVVNGYQFYFWTTASNGIQNGAPDGLSIDTSGSVNQFLSYEGTFLATNGVANGMNSVDIGISQSGVEPLGSSLGLTGGPGASELDFTWTAYSGTATPGQLNGGQSFVPAPGALALLGLAGIVGGRRRRRR